MHGMCSDSDDAYMVESAGALHKAGYDVVLFNHYGVPGEKNLRLIDFGEQRPIDEVLKAAKERFADASSLYLVGFSLGGNYALKYAGSAGKNRVEDKPATNDQSKNLKAVVAISNPFDLISTEHELRSTAFGVYGKFILRHYAAPYRYGGFHAMHRFPSAKRIYKSQNFLEIDEVTRAPACGYKSAEDLYKAASCDQFLKYIDVPFLVLHAKDDQICKNSSIPKAELLSNQNCVLMESEFGGHCDFYQAEKVPGTMINKRLYTDLLVKYLDDLEQFGSE